MRISDWSSDVCSSDLWPAPPPKLASSPVLPASGRSAIEDQGQRQGGRPEGRRIFQMNGIGSVADCPALVWHGWHPEQRRRTPHTRPASPMKTTNDPDDRLGNQAGMSGRPDIWEWP